MKLNITHFFRRKPESDDWIPLPFITQKPNDPTDSHFFGFETFREVPGKMIDQQLKDKTLKSLSWPVSVSPGQTLWLTPDNELYVASEKDPIGDQEKLMIDLASSVVIPEREWTTGDAC